MAVTKVFFIFLFCLTLASCINDKKEPTIACPSIDLAASTIESSAEFIVFVRYLDMLNMLTTSEDSLFLDSCYQNYLHFVLLVSNYKGQINHLLYKCGSDTKLLTVDCDNLAKSKIKLIREALKTVFLGTSNRRGIMKKIVSEQPYSIMFSIPYLNPNDKEESKAKLLNEKITVVSLLWYVSDAWYPLYFPKGRE